MPQCARLPKVCSEIPGKESVEIERQRKQCLTAKPPQVLCYYSSHFSLFSHSDCTPLVTFASIVADLELDSSWPTGGSSG